MHDSYLVYLNFRVDSYVLQKKIKRTIIFFRDLERILYENPGRTNTSIWRYILRFVMDLIYYTLVRTYVQ